MADRIVAIGGKMGHGKTWLADRLATQRHYHIFSIAGGIKTDITLLGLPPKEVYRSDKPPHIRELLQAYGKAMRMYDPDCWVARMWRAYMGQKRGFEDYDGDHVMLAAIDDLRFPNEVDYLRAKQETHKFELCLVRMVMPDDDAVRYGANDLSETSLDAFDEWDIIIEAPRGDRATMIRGYEAVINWMPGDAKVVIKGGHATGDDTEVAADEGGLGEVR
jgi:hypothetical protein